MSDEYEQKAMELAQKCGASNRPSIGRFGRGDTMTKTEQRIAIAEWMGWFLASPCANVWHLRLGNQIKESFPWINFNGQLPDPTLKNCIHQLPDYLNDLNAWRGVFDRKKLTQEQIVNFLNLFRARVSCELNKGKASDFDMLAGAIDRPDWMLEPLCRTLWPERFK